MINFAPDDKIDIESKLEQLINKIKSLKKSFIYIQDYININGSKMWCEEMHKLINYYVKIEANKFLKKKNKISRRTTRTSKIFNKIYNSFKKCT